MPGPFIESPSDPASDSAVLERQAAALEADARTLTLAYQRTTWIRFVLVFFPIPFVVVLLRLEVDFWMYYIWGALILGGGAVLYIVDTAASTRVDRAVAAAERARTACDEARAEAGAPGGIMPP